LRATAPAPDDRLGVVLNLTPAWPAGEGPEDARAAARIDLVQNRLFTDAVLHGRYPDEVLALHARHRIASRIDLGALAAGRQELDWLGVNYYNVNHVTHRPGAPAPAAWPGADEAVIVRPPGPVTAMDWGIHPEGLTWTLRRVAEAAPGLPVVIGENGAAYHDVVGPDGEVVDTDRIDR